MDQLNSRVFILNGQPFIIQQNNNINSISSINGDILQNALQEVDSSPSDSVHSQVDSDQFIQAVQSSEQGDCVDELVSYKQGNGDEPSTIHLTVEQAVELGIEFNVCGVDLPTNPPFSASEKSITSNKDQFIFSKDPSDNICLFSTGSNDTTNVVNATFEHTEQGVSVSSASDKISELKLQPNIIEQLNDSVNPQLTLIPQIHNGTITYTLQVDSNTETQLSTSNLPTTKDSVHMLPIETSVANTTFDLSSLTTSSSVVQSNLVMPSMSLSLSHDNHDRNQRVGFIANSNNILPETTEILGSETDNTIHDNLVVYQHESLPQLMQSEILAGNNQRFVRLASNSKTTVNSNTKNPTTLFMSVPPALEPISTVSNSAVTTTTSQPVKSKTSTTDSFQLSADQIKSQTLILPNGNKPLPIRPSILSNGIPKEVSKVVARFQSSDAGEKIGSNKNPIQLIQQGKTFTSMQSLTQHQLRHVAAVLTKNNFDIAQAQLDKNVIFDKKTNTKIIYRMIYPEDLHLKEATASSGGGTESSEVSSSGGMGSVPANKKRGRPLKVNSRAGEGGDQQHPQTPVEEPPRKKVPLPRTRSGRLSRPPRHIVRDYKRIRHRQDTDDYEQDGSYSDYQTDDQDDTPSSDHPLPHNQLLPGLLETKKRRISSSFRCPNCNKVYLGLHKMENHFFKYPDHRPPAPTTPPQPANAPPLSNSGVSGVEKPGGEGGGGISRGGGGSLSKRKFKRRSFVGSSSSSNLRPEQMRAQLKQLLDLCTETELVEVVGPVLANVLSAWELLLLRVDTLSSPSPSTCELRTRRVDALCAEIKTLLANFQEASAALFKPLDAASTLIDAAGATFEMKDLTVSSVLGIPCGLYRVDESLLKVDKILTNRRTEGSSDTVTHTATDKTVVAAAVVADDGDDKGGGKEGGVGDSVQQFQFGESDDMMAPACDERTSLDTNLDRFVNERLQNFTSTTSERLQNFTSTTSERLQNFTSVSTRDLSGSREVDELVFNQLTADAPDLSNLAEPFLPIGGGGRRPPHVSASTEDLIKSLENFVAAEDLPSDERTSFAAASDDNFNRVDALDFDVLSQNFHSGGASSQ